MGAADLLALSGEDDDLMGAWEELMMGARRGRRARRAVARGRATQGQLQQALVPRMPGSPSFGGRMDTLGLTPVTFTNVSGTALNMTATVNKAFKGSRLVLVVSRTAGAAAIAVTVNRFDIGQTNQFVSAQPVSADIYAPTAFGVEMALDPVTPGISLVLDMRVSALPGAGESVTVTGGIVGLSYS